MTGAPHACATIDRSLRTSKFIMRRIFFLLLAVMLAGCGQKGPLYMPADKPAAKPPVVPPPPPRTQPENPMGDPPGSR